MSWLKVLFSLCPHYPIQSEKLRKRLSQSIFRRCWMKQKAVIITITIIMVMMAMTTTMIVMLMLMVPVTWMLTGLVMHGEVDAFPSLQLQAVIAPELDVRSWSWDFPYNAIDTWYFLCFVVQETSTGGA